MTGIHHCAHGLSSQVDHTHGETFRFTLALNVCMRLLLALATHDLFLWWCSRRRLRHGVRMVISNGLDLRMDLNGGTSEVVSTSTQQSAFFAHRGVSRISIHINHGHVLSTDLYGSLPILADLDLCHIMTERETFHAPVDTHPLLINTNAAVWGVTNLGLSWHVSDRKHDSVYM